MTDEINGIRTYVIYGHYEGTNVNALFQYLSDSVDILSLWNHLPLLFCVKTRENISRLRMKLAPFFSPTLFIIMEVNRNQVDGYLPKEAWEWFSTPAPLQKRNGGLAQFFALPPPN